jgi:butyrate kinase
MPRGEFRVLAINPGSTSTKIAVYANELPVLVRNLCHSDEEMESFRAPDPRTTAVSPVED